MAAIDVERARGLLTTVRSNVAMMAAKDSEQEVRGLAVQAVDAALSAVRPLIADTVVMARVDDVISPYTIEQGEPMRAVDLLLVVDLMLQELPPPPRPPPPDPEDNWMTRQM
jgi:hypothetical protein